MSKNVTKKLIKTKVWRKPEELLTHSKLVIIDLLDNLTDVHVVVVIPSNYFSIISNNLFVKPCCCCYGDNKQQNGIVPERIFTFIISFLNSVMFSSLLWSDVHKIQF